MSRPTAKAAPAVINAFAKLANPLITSMSVAPTAARRSRSFRCSTTLIEASTAAPRSAVQTGAPTNDEIIVAATAVYARSPDRRIAPLQIASPVLAHPGHHKENQAGRHSLQ